MSVEYREWKKKSGAKSGGWYWRFMINGVRHDSQAVHPDNPKQKAKTKAEAKAFEAIAYQRAVQGIPIFEKPREEKTFKEFADEVYVPYSKANHRYHYTYQYYLKVLCETLGDRPLNSISPFLIEQFKLKQQKRGMSGNTIRLYLECGSAVFEAAIAEKLAASNPFRHVAIPELNTIEKLRLSREEEARLLAACWNPKCDGRRDRLASLIILMVELGPRPTELFHLTIDDVKWDERLVKFTSYKTGGRKKSQQSKVRWIPITDRAMAEFDKLRARAEGERLYPHDYIQAVWEGARKDAKLSEFWFRWLRSEAASRWVEAGASPYDVAYLLGHTRDLPGFGAVTKMSMIYVKPLLDGLREIMERASRGNCAILAQKEVDRPRIAIAK